MKTLISAEEVIEIAFTPLDQITPAALKKSKIKAAELAHIEPVINGLYPALLEGKYPQFLELLKPAVAYFVRYTVIPDLLSKVGNSGPQVPYTNHTNTATDRQRDAVRQQANMDARAFLDRAIEEIESDPLNYPEYTPRKNVQRRVFKNGGIIITR